MTHKILRVNWREKKILDATLRSLHECTQLSLSFVEAAQVREYKAEEEDVGA